MARLLYKPLALVFGVLGGVAAGAVFEQVWKLAAGEPEAPDATDQDRGWAEILTAAAAHGAVYALVRAAIDRAGATLFHKATGVWPGDEASKAVRSQAA